VKYKEKKMIESLYIGATGMQAQQTNLDVIANNLANVNTSGYKKSKINFEELMYKTMMSTNGVQGPLGSPQYIGIGSAVATTSKVYSQGEVKSTTNPLDLAIQGDGLFELQLPDGSYAYTRNGSFQKNSEGYLTDNNGYLLMPLIQIPSDATDITIKPNGSVSVKVSGESAPIDIGQIELANFTNPQALTPLGDNLYAPNKETGIAYYATPNENGFGGLTQGYLEGSNVQLIDELLGLILAQRAYEVNSRVVQASDEMLSMVNNLRR
jgi:flagellar basal-body rod protein FlgG